MKTWSHSKFTPAGRHIGFQNSGFKKLKDLNMFSSMSAGDLILVFWSTNLRPMS